MNKREPSHQLSPLSGPAAQRALEQALAQGLQHQRNGRLGEAEQCYRTVLRSDSQHPDVLHFLGLLKYKTGFKEEGLRLVEEAVVVRPDYADAHSNLGNLLQAEERLEEAVAAYRRALQLNPRHPQAHNNLGVALKDLGRLDEAAAAFRRAFKVAPKSGDAHLNLANVLTLQGKHDEAIAEYRRAVELDSGLLQGFVVLSNSLRQRGREAEAIKVWEDLSQKAPDHPVVKHMLAASAGRDAPSQATQGYVRAIFDGFADTFDSVLEGLDYRAPALVTGLIASLLPAGKQDLDVLDAGCGTGLCAPFLKPYARRLTGVDLSAGMLAKARRRKLYDELVEAELTDYLQNHPASFDLIASADTLVYFGDLAPILKAAATALRPGGLLVFSLENLQEAAPASFRLHPHGRYSHSEDYARFLLTGARLDRVTVAKEVLRKERGQPVPGLLVAAHKP